MIEICKKHGQLVVKGHASEKLCDVTDTTREACIRMTTLIEFLHTGLLTVCREQVPMKLEYGLFVLDITHLSKPAEFLLYIFETYTRDLVLRYPSCIRWVDDVPDETKDKISFPDWRNYIV